VSLLLCYLYFALAGCMAFRSIESYKSEHYGWASAFATVAVFDIVFGTIEAVNAWFPGVVS